MKQFSLEEYLKNPSRKVVTRDGRDARIICTDAMGQYLIIALIDEQHRASKLAFSFTKDGHFCQGEENVYDLFFASAKHEGWMNIYSDSIKYGGEIYDTENDAKNSATSDVVATIKIEWEE